MQAIGVGRLSFHSRLRIAATLGKNTSMPEHPRLRRRKTRLVRHRVVDERGNRMAHTLHFSINWVGRRAS